MEHIRFLKRNIDLVSVEDRKAVARVLVLNGQQALLHACAEGAAVNLDQVPAVLLGEMAALLAARMAARGRSVEAQTADG